MFILNLKSQRSRTNPPIGRAATSIGHTPRSFSRNSPCTGPCVSPKARVASAKLLLISSCSVSVSVKARRKWFLRSMGPPADPACRRSPARATLRRSAGPPPPLPCPANTLPQSSGPNLVPRRLYLRRLQQRFSRLAPARNSSRLFTRPRPDSPRVKWASARRISNSH